MNVVVVIAPATCWSRTRGFRHGIIPGERRTLCGRDADEWQGDVRTLDPVPFAAAQVGCRVCIRAHGARERRNSTPQPLRPIRNDTKERK